METTDYGLSFKMPLTHPVFGVIDIIYWTDKQYLTFNGQYLCPAKTTHESIFKIITDKYVFIDGTFYLNKHKICCLF